MATVAEIERQIRRIEGFRVRILDPSGRDARADKPLGNAAYSYARAANGNDTVAQWRQRRFADLRLQGTVEVLSGGGVPAHGSTLLSTIRNGY